MNYWLTFMYEAGPYTIDPKRPLKWFFFSGHFMHHCLFGFIHLIQKKWTWDNKFMIMWWMNLCLRGSSFTVCLQVCWVLHFLTRCNPRYVTDYSSTDAKSPAWIRFDLNLELLRNMQLLCCRLWPSAPRDAHHHVITFFESREWNQRSMKQPGKKAISKDVWDQ